MFTMYLTAEIKSKSGAPEPLVVRNKFPFRLSPSSMLTACCSLRFVLLSPDYMGKSSVFLHIQAGQ